MPEAPQPAEPVEVFYAYSHKDEDLRDQLETHLAMSKRTGVITGWHDRRISAGKEWSGTIDEHLNSADIILLLVSSDFLASDYCYDAEIMRAMERHESGDARVIPIILRPCDWTIAPFGKLQPLPKDAKPITVWSNYDSALLDVDQGIRSAAEEINLKKFGKTLAKIEAHATQALAQLQEHRQMVDSMSHGTLLKEILF